MSGPGEAIAPSGPSLRSDPTRSEPTGMAVLGPLLREIGDLKRTTSAGRTGSIAERAFVSAWSALVGGQPVEQVAFGVTARILAATRLGDLDRDKLRELGLRPDEALGILQAGFDAVSDPVDEPARSRLRDALALDDGLRPTGAIPPFVAALAAQPRAGATCPGRPRVLLGPAENHGEHCLVTAVYGVLLSGHYGADPVTVFLAALAHHLHNAAMPDAGFAGETLLGERLQPLMNRATERALDELANGLRADVVVARGILPDADSPEGRAFHAADVIDRVLELRQHVERHRVGMDEVLGEMALVHEGPVKGFHDRVLGTMGLL